MDTSLLLVCLVVLLSCEYTVVYIILRSIFNNNAEIHTKMR